MKEKEQPPATAVYAFDANGQFIASAVSLAIGDVGVQNKVRALSAMTSVEEIRKGLLDLSPILIPYFCWWPWLDPFLIVNCIRTVPVDENGRFQTTIWYPCVLGPPNLYFKAQQHHGMVWEWIYRPPV